MKDKVLKLCRRLKKCTLNDFIEFIGIEEKYLKPLLKYLVDTEFLEENNGVYNISQNVHKKGNAGNKNFQFMTMFHSPQTIDLIIRCFCLMLPTQKVAYLAQLGDSCLCDFYKIFRNLIFERQQNELLNYYIKAPKKGRYREFFNKRVYFYSYSNKIFVSKKQLYGYNEINFSNKEILELKKVYSYLSRIESHNKNEFCLHQRLAENIWRRNKSFAELYNDLKCNLLNIS